MLRTAFACSLLAMAAQAGSTEEWKKRSVYQVLTDRFARSDQGADACQDLHDYCGGDYKGMISKLDYIQGMGFDAIWISPIVDNTDKGYHGYWARNWEKLNENFGSEDDLKALVNAAHEKDIWVMVDVVANHCGPVGDDFSQLYPFSDSDDFHSDCKIDWSDQNSVENCRLAGLPDLDQNNSYVRKYLKDWVKGIVETYGFDGLRIDTIPEVPKDFWAEYGAAAGVFQMGECFKNDSAYVGPYQQALTGLFNYPMFYTIRDVFGDQKSMFDIYFLQNEESAHFTDLDALGVFVDNHDNGRFLSRYENNRERLKAAQIFALTNRGIPFTYYGTEQYYTGGKAPNNRESLWQSMNTDSDFYKLIQIVNSQRKLSKIWDQRLIDCYIDDSFYVFSRGKFLVALTNSDEDQHRGISVHPFKEGTTVCNIFKPTTDCRVISHGFTIYLLGGESKIYVPNYLLAAEAFANESKIDIVQ